MGISILKDETSKLSRNVGHVSSSNADPPPRTTGTSTAPLLKAKKWQSFVERED
jgi:hypothetical protein